MPGREHDYSINNLQRVTAIKVLICLIMLRIEVDTYEW